MGELLLFFTGFFFGMFVMQTIDMFTILKEFKGEIENYKKKLRR
tara:strand:- start:1157 stop:1288 length:132 start_codon:yes stop_codon:yes gene_type:complete